MSMYAGAPVDVQEGTAVIGLCLKRRDISHQRTYSHPRAPLQHHAFRLSVTQGKNPVNKSTNQKTML